MRTGLWRNRDFMKLWVGETVSLFGSQFTQLALPLTAVLFLQATPLQMGISRRVRVCALYSPLLIRRGVD